MHKSLFYFLLILSFRVFAQVPTNDLFLFDLKIDKVIDLTNPRNITKRAGYDSQPAFLLDGSAILYSSIRDDGQADIYKYDLGSKEITKLTNTPFAHEYSPTPISDTHFSTVRIEEDSVTQRLWKFSMDGKEKSLILKNVYRVGYHGWADSNKIGLFILGEGENDPFTFQIATVNDGESRIICENPGRSFHKVPGENALSYIHKISDQEWIIKKIDLSNNQISVICNTLKGSEDMVWIHSIKTILMGKGSILYKYSVGKDKDWQQIADLKNFGITGINRIAVSPKEDKLVLVSSL